MMTLFFSWMLPRVVPQEKFRPGIHHFNEIVQVAARLIAAAKELSIPVLVTEQVYSLCGAVWILMRCPRMLNGVIQMER